MQLNWQNRRDEYTAFTLLLITFMTDEEIMKDISVVSELAIYLRK